MEKDMNSDLLPQYKTAMAANIPSFIYGMAIGWTAPMQPLIEMPSYDTGENVTTGFGELPFKVTSEEMSWVSAIFSIAGCLGTPLFGYCANAFGRRISLVLSAGIFLTSFTTIITATSAAALLCARVAGGIAAAGTAIVVPMYIGETVEVKIRGVLSSFFNLFLCSGILTSFIIGSYFGSDERTKYFVLAGIMIVVTIIFFPLAYWLPETPVYCLVKDRPDQAFNSLLKLRGNNRRLVEREMAAMAMNTKEAESGNEKTMSILDMFRDKATRRGLIIVNTLLLIQQASGISPILNFTVAIFNASGNSSISGALATIIVGILMIVGSLLGTILMDKAGRKMLLLLSSITMAVTLAPIAGFFYLIRIGTDSETLEMIGWLPVTSLSTYVVGYCVGFGPVPYVLISEIFKTNAKSAATSLSIYSLVLLCFVILKFFGNVSDAIGIDVCFAFFSISCIAGAIFTVFCVVETKGKPLPDIIRELEASKTQGPEKTSSGPMEKELNI